MISFVNNCFISTATLHLSSLHLFFDSEDASKDPREFNDSYLCLILEKEITISSSDFHPIGICNTILKLITKIVVHMIKHLLSDLINPLQAIFISNRTVDENVIIIEEVTHIFKKAKKSKHIMALKIDLIKGVDSLE